MENVLKVFIALAMAFVIMGVSLVLTRKLAAWLDRKKKNSKPEDEANKPPDTDDCS